MQRSEVPPEGTGRAAPHRSGGGSPQVALSVAGAARGLGVAPATLRSWERRYGLVPSLHTAGGHRRYGPVDLARLALMNRLVQEGAPPAEAARAAISAHIDARAIDAANPFAALLAGTGGAVPVDEQVPAPDRLATPPRPASDDPATRPGPASDVPAMPPGPAPDEPGEPADPDPDDLLRPAGP
ncbi:MAG: MerR family transcriptional regulator, partial [Candidatus Nanopelagicales bacterium]